MSLRIKKGDMVKVKACHGYAQNGSSTVLEGQIGRVLAVYPKNGTAIVEGLNLYKKHQKARSQQEQGGIIEKEVPLPMGKLMLVESGGKRRSGRFTTRTDDKGNKVRVLRFKDENGKVQEVTV